MSASGNSEPKRIAFLYSVARSGSTYVEKAIGAYLAQYWGHESLSELFNINLPVNLIENKITPDLNNWRGNQYRRLVDPIQSNLEILQRLDWLEQTNASYFFKLLVGEMRPEYLARLIPQSTVFFSRRLNLWEHLLSFLISRTTSQYYPKGGMKWEKASVKADISTFVEFFYSIRNYYRLRKQNPLATEIIFEHCLNDMRNHMQNLGLNKEFDWENVAFPPKENLEDKQLAFSNLEEIRSWYINTSLNLIHPIDASEK